MERETFERLLEKYNEGECNELEEQLLFQWYEHFQATGEPAVQNEAEYNHTKQQLWEAVRSHTKQAPIRRFLSWKYAAAACLLILAGMAAWKLSLVHKSPAIAWREISNNSNAVRNISLPDGSAIWLNKGASISYNGDYGVKGRVIRLTGEAYFNVQPNPTAPFSVETKALITHVLGTSFNVEAYPYEQEIRVSLSSGKVALEHSTHTLTLQPGQVATLNEKTTMLTTAEVAVSDISAWTRNKIVFNEIPLANALARLEHLYNTKLVYDSLALSGYRVTGEFTKEAFEDVLASVLTIHRIPYKKTGTIYTIGHKNKRYR